ncbi:hypothetical protein [Phaeobacter sp. HF9A]|uniref:hypothetical protein n=1 Tax=Phaeobacter sp. HF9A TaxID=2721561 RepID=UPI0014315F05|nr:hypothetical protein [Phaeobacter sp. HF9A]NIZ11956.1 hypothetical protein [Phaeobacter sp. HF9A]
MNTDYFTDREYGTRPAISETINIRVWGALYSLVGLRIGNGAFGFRFAEQCPDGRGACGCDQQAFGQFLQAEVPWLEWPLRCDKLPETPVVLDLLEFCAKAVGEPISVSYHSYYDHHHLKWERAAGLASFVADVNLLLQRNGIAFKLDDDGRAQRILPQPVAQALGWKMFNTGDTELDRLLEYARSRFLAPKLEDRRDATEKLWDAFERMKTLEPGSDKRAQADALLDCAAAPGTKMRAALADEAKSLTSIGNSLRIRHSEVTQEMIDRSEQLDWLFVRMFGFLRLLLLSSGRSNNPTPTGGRE